MSANERKLIWFFIGILMFFGASGFSILRAQHRKKPFTVTDDIETSLLLPQEDGPTLRTSPDGSYFAVYSERGNMERNEVEDSLRFYRSKDIEDFLVHPAESRLTAPVWVVNRSEKEGPVIHGWRWLPDSSGVVFLQPEADGNYQLVLANVRQKTVEALTSRSDRLAEYAMFDVRDRTHYVYTAADLLEARNVPESRKRERHAPAIVGTERSLFELLLPEDPVVKKSMTAPKSYLWAVIGGRRFQVKHDGKPLVPVMDGMGRGLALAPDARSIVMKLPVPEVPSSWEALYPPPWKSSPLRIRAGHDTAKQFVRVALDGGAVQSLTDAPVSLDGGWIAYGSADWSSDGREIVLPGTFVKSKGEQASRPCVAIVAVGSDTSTCVELLKSSHADNSDDKGSYTVIDSHFAGGNKQRVFVTFWKENWLTGTREYQRSDDRWEMVREFDGDSQTGAHGLEVTVRQNISQPPLLVASVKGVSRVIWDPNPQLKDFDLGEARVFTWRDKEGREQKGGLYEPANYRSGQRYPLVLQTHGFLEEGFRPSGTGFGPAYAARELAGAGIAVLQLGEECDPLTPTEGACAVSDYEAAANQLVSDGLANPDRIGIIGFSRTCYYVMEALVAGSSLHLKAASVTDGTMQTYFEYIQDPGPNAAIGAAPFGEGLQQWLKRSPGFNLDKITTPLLVNTEGRGISLLEMWEPYAGLRYLRKPVDLIILNTDEHVLTNPAVRMASQGGSVDWFRFWLQGYEDPDPAKAEQYKRWRALRGMQENEKKSAAPAN
jgi:dipeptidyl aminopeptidase/acylaminoacyl peptidase